MGTFIYCLRVDFQTDLIVMFASERKVLVSNRRALEKFLL